MADKIFVVTTQPEDKIVKIIGPFATMERASAWGARWQKRNFDCPCWQVMEIRSGAKVERHGASWEG
jgi:hypothetical protein